MEQPHQVRLFTKTPGSTPWSQTTVCQIAMSIESLARELLALKERSRQQLESGDLDSWLEGIGVEFVAAERLHDYLLNHPVVVTDDGDVKRLLEEIDLTEIRNPDKKGSDLLFSRISPAEYGSALAQVRILVTPFRIPWHLQAFIDEARQCFALGQYCAVQSLSRTILEAAVNDIAVRIGCLPKAVIEKDLFQKYPPKKRIQMVAANQFKTIYAHYRDLCTVIHGLDTSSSVGPLTALTKTLGFVDYLYDQHKQVIRERKGEPEGTANCSPPISN